jgi:Arc/MetJ-type ribon-helix-helix transcriptional regulator
VPTISVRITEEDKKQLLRYGPLSHTVREALELYVKDRKKREALRSLAELQRKYPVRVDPDDIVRLIREDRRSH